MKKENFSTISNRFLDKAYGKSKEELLYMYQNDRQFRADYEAVKQYINDVLLPVLKEVYEAIEATIKELAEGMAEWAKQNPEIINALQKNGVKNSLEFGA